MGMVARLGTPRSLACALGVGVRALQRELLCPDPPVSITPLHLASPVAPSLVWDSQLLAPKILVWGAVTLKYLLAS